MKKNYLKLLHFYERLSRPIRLGIWACIILILISIRPIYLSVSPFFRPELGSAHLYFVPPINSPAVGETFVVELRVKTGKYPINAVGSTIILNPHTLQIIKISTEPSFCSFYTENSFDTIKGEVHIECGTPNPGFQGDSTVVQLTLRSTTSGSTDIKILPESAEILANDGKATNLAGIPPQLTLTIHQSY